MAGKGQEEPACSQSWATAVGSVSRPMPGRRCRRKCADPGHWQARSSI